MVYRLCKYLLIYFYVCLRYVYLLFQYLCKFVYCTLYTKILRKDRYMYMVEKKRKKGIKKKTFSNCVKIENVTVEFGYLRSAFYPSIIEQKGCKYYGKCYTYLF